MKRVFLIMCLSFNIYAGPVSDFERGFAAGRSSCKSVELHSCTIKFNSGDEKVKSLTMEGFSRAAALKSIIDACYNYENTEECRSQVRNLNTDCKKL